MKKILIMSSLVFSSALHSIAVEAATGSSSSGATTKVARSSRRESEIKGGSVAVTKTTATKKSLTAVERANHLTDEMIRDLRLSNYQARELRKINQEKVNRMMAIEAAGGDVSAIDNQCKGVCKDRDKELEDLLSTEQYMQYFSKRQDYYKLDKDYASGGFMNQDSKTTAKADNLADNDDEVEGSNTQVASR